VDLEHQLRLDQLFLRNPQDGNALTSECASRTNLPFLVPTTEKHMTRGASGLWVVCLICGMNRLHPEAKLVTELNEAVSKGVTE
jgi:hypothetical protein